MSFIMMHNIRREGAQRQTIAIENAIVAHQLQELKKTYATPEGLKALFRLLTSAST
jgi:hypothetical protein